jgi:hypothetical protein
MRKVENWGENLAVGMRSESCSNGALMGYGCFEGMYAQEYLQVCRISNIKLDIIRYGETDAYG